MEKGNKNKYMFLTLLLLLLVVIGATYAYFTAQKGTGGSAQIEVGSETTDSLTFEAGKPINITASAADFYKNAGDKSGTTTATAKLVPNNTTNKATENYNIYFIIDENDFIYSTPDEQIELLLKVTNPEKEPVTNIEALVYDSELQGFDITKRKGAFKISLNEEIKATDINGFSEEWQIEVILRNLEVDQQANTGKTFSGRLLITTGTEDTYIVPELNSINEVSKNYDSITVSLIGNENHTAPIDKYYYAIEETDEEPESTSILSIAEKLEPTYEASDAPTYTFSNLMENQSYKIYAYAKDTQGIRTDIKTAIIETDDYTRISLTEVNIGEVNHHGFKVTATAVEGTNQVKEYAFKIEGDDKYGEWSNWQTENEFTFTELKAGLNYKVQVKARDEANKETITSFDKEQTTTSYTVKVEVTNGNSEPPENQVIENSEATFNIIASEGYDITTAQVTEGEGCILSEDKGTLTVSNVTSDITCKVNIDYATLSDFIIKKVNTNVGLGTLAKHDTIGAQDNSYRYSGNNPNNFVCFGNGSDAYNNGGSECPDKNLYRIIGVFNNQVKLIKSEYILHDELGIASDGTPSVGSYDTLKRVKEKAIDGFKWNQDEDNSWENSTIYQVLNDKYLTNLSTWANKIVPVTWYVSGYSTNQVTAKEMYDAEMASKLTVPASIGLMYVSDYGFASASNNWSVQLINYNDDNGNRENNWLFNNTMEWTISPTFTSSRTAFRVSIDGDIVSSISNVRFSGIRPTFYLNSNVQVKIDNAIGDVNSPFRIVI